MILPLNTQTLAANAKSDSDSTDVDVLREMLLAIGRIPMLSIEEEERLARGIKSAKGRLRRSMLQSPQVTLKVADLLDRVAGNEERLDRALDVTLAELKEKDRLRQVAKLHANTLRGIVSERAHRRQSSETRPDGLLSERESRKVQRLVDEALVRTQRVEELFAAEGGSANRRYQLARQRYENLRNRMVAANLRLAVSIAKKYQRAGVPLMDLIQEGSEGLIRAAEKFKPSLGFKFSTYSVWWIQQRIRSAVAEKSRMIRIGEAAANRLKRLQAEALQESDDPFGQAVSFEDLQLPPTTPSRREELRKSFYVCRDVLSLDMPLQSNSQLTHADSLASSPDDPDSGLVREERQQAIGVALKDLTSRECDVLRLRFGLSDGIERNLAEVGRILQISRERVRQIEQASLKKLRERLQPELVN